MKRRNLFVTVFLLVIVAFVCFVYCQSNYRPILETQSKEHLDSLADVDIDQEKICNEDLHSIVKACMLNGGCVIWDSSQAGQMICICAEPEEYQADRFLLFFVYQSQDGGNVWKQSGHGALSSNPARSIYWINSSLKPFFGENNKSNSILLLDTIKEMCKVYHW